MEAEPDAPEHGALYWIGAIVAPLGSSIGAYYAGRAWGLSTDSVHSVELIVPAAILGALEVLPVAPRRVVGDANARHEDRIVRMGRGALVGASLAVLTEAFYKRGFPAVGHLLTGAAHVEAGDIWWAVMMAVVLSVAARRALQAAALRLRGRELRWPPQFRERRQAL